jgi:toxin ParE1/3/4
MPELQYSQQSEVDLDRIATFTRKRWGQSQADAYFNGLAEIFEKLAQSPSMGRTYSRRFSKWRRFEHQSHVILHQPIPSGIRIQRVMHNRRKIQGANR